MDFYQIKTKVDKKALIIYPDFFVGRTKDIMIRGKSFYAIWDEEAGLWSTDEFDVARLVDKSLYSYADQAGSSTGADVVVKSMKSFSSKSWKEFKDYVKNMSDNSKQLDTKVTFANTEVKKSDYISKRLPYDLEEGKPEAYEELISTLYNEDERRKLEWAIGAIISGDAKTIQKFIVLYGEAGAGKSTVLNIIQGLFEGYYTVFDAKALTSNSNAFSTEQFRTNPLVAIQHDGDLSRIEDNTKLNSIVSHEEIIINEKYKSGYPSRMNCFLFMGTNKPVKITDGKSGIIRRLIDVRPSGRKVPVDRYNELISHIQFEYGKIANHCLKVYKEMGKSYYSTYKPVDMMYKTDPFYNFVEENYIQFKKDDGVSLKQAYAMYKEYCDYANADYKLQMYKFREELKNYFKNFEDIARVDNVQVRSYYSGFLWKKFEKFKDMNEKKEHSNKWLVLDSTESILDKECSNCFAQYANSEDKPVKTWDNVKTVLSDIDTKKVHYVRVPENHIVIDFDIKGDDGQKSLEKNIDEAIKFPPTYAETSKSGNGLHLHYIYDGDVSQLSRVYDKNPNIEIKIFTGKSSLRRKLIACNTLAIAHIASGLPLREKKGASMVDKKAVADEKELMRRIKKCLNKEYEDVPSTASNVSLIKKMLDDAYESGMHYDLTTMRPAILYFAGQSTHQSEQCIKLVNQMKFKSDEPSVVKSGDVDESKLVFYDVEVFPNLFLVNWKIRGSKNVIRMINPTPNEIEDLLKFNLVGFNCRRYDNHIMYARMMGYTNEQLYTLSQRIISTDKKDIDKKNCFFGQAYDLSYTDVYDFASAGHKQSLKKFEIELGIHHQELGLPWDQPVPEEMWPKVAEYCDNDVIATEATFDYLKADWEARKALAKIAGGTPNDTTNSLTTKLIFGNNKHPQDEFIYTDLSEMFPGYKFELGKSTYKDEEVGEGGYVYAEPGMYGNVALLDIASMHPHSIIALNLFGDRYTKIFQDLVNARLAVKHKDKETLKIIFNGAFAEYADADDETLNNLATALKTAINSVYGLTDTKFENPFRDPRNIDNIVAKRGALFMVNLKEEVQKRGFTVAHIKTDSIKIPDATPEIIQFVMDYGKQYGYSFEHEATYERMCLVNNAVYIAKYKDGKHAGEWTATGTQFAVPYVFKTLFTHEEIIFSDMCETKSVKTAIHIDMNEGLGEGEHNYIFVGKVGSFCPVVSGGGDLVAERSGKDGETKYSAVTGTKGYKWLESETVKELKKENDIDKSYYNKLVDDAIDTISEFGDFEWFVSDKPYQSPPFVGAKIV